MGLRARIAALVLLASIPAAGLILFSALEERHRAGEEAAATAARIARFEAQRQAQVIEGARQALIALAGSYLEFLRNGNRLACRNASSALVEQSFGLYRSVGLVRRDGGLYCSSVLSRENVPGEDRPFFRRARNGEFAVGDLERSAVTGVTGIDFGYPVRDPFGSVEGVAYISLDTTELDRRMAEMPLPPHVLAVITDSRGIVIASRGQDASAARGEPFSHPLAREAIARDRGGLLASAEWNGEPWLLAYEPVARNANGSVAMRLFVTVPQGLALAEASRTLVRDLTLLACAIALLLVLAWWGAELTLMPRLRALLDAARRVGSGDLAARTGLVDDGDELGRLGRSFDEMAALLETRNRELEHALRQVGEQAVTDPLTGLANRRHLDELLARELTRAARSGAPLAVIMLDIDHFKAVNDRLGHAAGDQVLRRVAGVLKAGIRGSDIACRHGGEEMLVVLPGATAAEASHRAEALRTELRSLEVEHAGRKVGPVSASFGVAEFPANGGDMEALLRAADAALYRAKDAGRDRVALALPVD